MQAHRNIQYTKAPSEGSTTVTHNHFEGLPLPTNRDGKTRRRRASFSGVFFQNPFPSRQETWVSLEATPVALLDESNRLVRALARVVYGFRTIPLELGELGAEISDLPHVARHIDLLGPAVLLPEGLRDFLLQGGDPLHDLLLFLLRLVSHDWPFLLQMVRDPGNAPGFPHSQRER